MYRRSDRIASWQEKKMELETGGEKWCAIKMVYKMLYDTKIKRKHTFLGCKRFSAKNNGAMREVADVKWIESFS